MKLAIVVLALSASALAQEGGAVSIPFSDPNRPKMVRATMMNGTLTVSGYDGKDVQVDSGRSQRRNRRADGLRRIDTDGLSVTAEEDNNTIRINSGMEGHLIVRVPFDTSVKLETLNGGDLKVDHLSGNIELSNLNGAVTATNVSGPVIAHSMNGRVTVTFDKVPSDKAMSLSTMNGDVDLTMPGDTRATVKLRADNGEMFTDFDLKLTGNPQSTSVDDARSKGGKYKVKVERTTIGTINGGGPDLALKTVNGSIYLRKAK